MIRLHLLGSQHLEGEAGDPLDAVVAQPKRFALLAYLALGGAGFIRRDTILTVFWPELDQFGARRSLRNAVYQLRRALGTDVFRTRGDEEIGIDADALWCDASALGAAAEEGRFEEVVALYRGELLPGFHLPGVGEEFESWLVDQRERTARHTLRALDALVTRDERAGHSAEAARWAMRAQEIAPYDEAWVRRTMTLLAAAGQSVGAIRAYDAFARRVREELGGTPAPDTSRLAARLRTESAAAGAEPISARAVEPPQLAVAPDSASPKTLAPARAPTPDRVREIGTGERDTAEDSPAAPIRRGRPKWAIGSGLVAAAVVAGVWLLGHRTRLATARGAASPTLAVLPFEHDGPATDGYLAGGITDDIRSRLAALPGLRIIAGASSDQYPNVGTGVQRIGHELGAEYLLTGRIERAGPGDSTRVRVTPELIRVSDATTAWTVPFDASPTDLLDVQTRVAEAVVKALSVRLADSARVALSRLPTGNGAAYDAYLRGQAIYTSGPADAAMLHKAVAELEHAVALDTNFAPAWAALAVARTRLFQNSGSVQRSDITRARFAAQRALALDSTLPNARAAMAGYYSVGENDEVHALHELRMGLRSSPHDAALLILVALSERALGQWDSAVVRLQEARSADPRNATVLYDLGITLFVLRRYPEAREAAERAIELAPDAQDWQLLAMLSLAAGDLTAARAVMTRAGESVDPTTLVTFMATYGDLFWALDERERALLLRLTPASFGDDHFNWSYALAGVSWVDGDSAATRAYADTARRTGEESLRNDPKDPQTISLLAVANAYEGRRDVALRLGEQAVAMCRPGADEMTRGYVLEQLARIYTVLGENDRAVATAAKLLRMPSYLSTGWLRVDPTFAPLRGNAAFKRLLGEDSFEGR